MVPTEFDALSPTTALLWLYRNVAPEVVWAGVVGGAILCLVLVCMVGAISLYFGCSCCGITRGINIAATASRAVQIEPSVEEPPDQGAVTPVLLPRLLLPGTNLNALNDRERQEYAIAMRRALHEAHLSIRALMPQEPSSQDVSGVEEID